MAHSTPSIALIANLCFSEAVSPKLRILNSAMPFLQFAAALLERPIAKETLEHLTC